MLEKPVRCPVCGNLFWRPHPATRGRPRKYCGIYCSAVAQIEQSRASHERKQAAKSR